MTCPHARRPGARPLLVAAVGAAVVALAVGVAACGVPLDGAPRAINRTTTTLPDETTLPASDTVGTPTVELFFLDGNRLVRSTVSVKAKPTPESAIGLVLATKPDAPLQTRIPPGTSLLDLRVRGPEASIDLSDAIEDISGPTQKEAYAQLVFTALQFQEITSVRFLVEGQPVDAPTDNSNLAVVTDKDFDEPLRP